MAGNCSAGATQPGPLLTQGGWRRKLSGGGRQPIALAGGETRTFLEDGDRVTLRGWCERQGYARIRFGEGGGTGLAAWCDPRRRKPTATTTSSWARTCACCCARIS